MRCLQASRKIKTAQSPVSDSTASMMAAFRSEIWALVVKIGTDVRGAREDIMIMGVMSLPAENAVLQKVEYMYELRMHQRHQLCISSSIVTAPCGCRGSVCLHSLLVSVSQLDRYHTLIWLTQCILRFSFPCPSTVRLATATTKGVGFSPFVATIVFRWFPSSLCR